MRFKLLFALCLLFSQIVKAQFNHDFDILPKPYQGVEYYGDKASSCIKKLTQIKKVDTDRGEYNDTVRIFTYQEDGRKTSLISYRKNKIERTYSYKYKDASEMVWEEIQELNTIYRSISNYDKDGNILNIKKYNLRRKDTLYPQQATFYYKNGKLVTREDRINNIVNSLRGYSWEGNKLIKATNYLKPENKKYYYEYVYTYSLDGRLTESNMFQQRDTIRDHLQYEKYNYEGKYLIEERYTSMSQLKEEIRTLYSYFESGKLKNVNVSRPDNSYLDIVYQYGKDGQLYKKIITTNTDKQFKQVFLLVPYTISSVKPYTIEEVYEYDEKLNITSVSRYAKNELYWQMVYDIEYYQ